MSSKRLAREEDVYNIYTHELGYLNETKNIERQRAERILEKQRVRVGLVTFSHCCGSLAAVHEAHETSVVLWLPLPA